MQRRAPRRCRRSSASSTTTRRCCRCTGSISLGQRARMCASTRSSMSSICPISVISSSSRGGVSDPRETAHAQEDSYRSRRLVALFVVVGAMQPSEFQVERTATIAATPADVFAQVNDLHKWDAWSPWAKLDPNAKIAFEGPDAGQGAAMSWAGNDKVGEGKMTVVESKPNDAVRLKVDFVKPLEGT